jgi:hypothetical protein
MPTSEFSRITVIKYIIDKKTIFLVTQEPTKQDFPQQHYLWQQTRKEGKYEYTDLNEVERGFRWPNLSVQRLG